MKSALEILSIFVDSGFSVPLLTRREVARARLVSTGIEEIDKLLVGDGYPDRSSILGPPW